MKIISLNVNGLRAATRRGFVEWVKGEDPDILCLQEIKISEGEIPFDLIYLGDYFPFFNYASVSGYAGTAVYTKEKPISFKRNLGFERFDSEGRFSELVYKSATLINVYMPHGSRDKKNLDYKLKSYNQLLDYLSKQHGKDVILLGDFNIAHKGIDLARPYGNTNNTMFTDEERKRLDNLVNLGFVDSLRKFEKGTGHYTWWPWTFNAYERNLGWRIDYCFVSKSLEDKLKSAYILRSIRISDHCPIGIEFIPLKS